MYFLGCILRCFIGFVVKYCTGDWMTMQTINLHKTNVKATNMIEPAHVKTYNKTCVTSKDSDQPVHPPSMARFSSIPLWDGGCRRHMRSVKIDQTAQMCRLIRVLAGRTSYCRFCRALAHICVKSIPVLHQMDGGLKTSIY